jgi:N-acetylglucosamine kinase
LFRWGHLLGDEGSAYWIAQRAIKRVFDHEDNFNLSRYDLTRLNNEIKGYFKVKFFLLFLFFIIFII